MNSKAEKVFRIVSATGSVDVSQIPGYVKENLAQSAYAGALRAWNDPEFRAGYEQWKSEHQTNGGIEIGRKESK